MSKSKSETASKRSAIVRILALMAMLAALASPVYADAGAPMLIVMWPLSWVALILVIPAEAFVARRVRLANWRTGLRVSVWANLVSSLAGIPVTWIILVVIQVCVGGFWARGFDTVAQKVYAVTVQSPWLIPYEGADALWMGPAAAAFLCIPFFFMSVWCEYLVARRFFQIEQRPLVKRWAWLANALSYGIIIVCLLAVAVYHR